MEQIELDLMAALYGNKPVPSAQRIAEAQEARALEISRVENEFQHQCRVHRWLKENNVLHFHPPNEGKRSEDEWKKLKASGASPGVPDLFIMEPRKPHHGLILELKRSEGGVISAPQEWWLESLNRRFYKACVSWSYEESISIIQAYLNLPRW